MASGDELSAAQRARAERQRRRARALRDARRAAPPPDARPLAPDGGGGFVREESPPRAAPTAAPAPLADPAARPACLGCARRLAHSQLLDAFDHPVCDECRDDDGEHALLTRTEAKAHFLLRDCDLDARQPPLRALRRRNPHGARLGDMRLYLRAQLAERARTVWGSDAALEAERARRDEERARRGERRAARGLRALRMAVRSSLFDRTHAPHAHDYGAETYDAEADRYSRVCKLCAHALHYEKM